MSELALLPASPTQSELGDFKAHVRTWLELDTDIRRMQEALKTGKMERQKLTEGIMTFMRRFGFMHLNLRECQLSCRVRQVYAPLPRRVIRDRIMGAFDRDPVAARLVADSVFSRDRIERVNLQRRPAVQSTTPEG